MAQITVEKQLSIISKAWGRQRGYCFFPWISGEATNREQRIKSYHEGPAFRWPLDKTKILRHMRDRQNDDMYWCPSLFERKRRQTEMAMDEHALWADLDEVDPHTIEEYPPTVAWETSPGRYQALWLITAGDMQGASWQGGENHRLTYYLEADPSGWDTTQLLRVPGWKNHKPEHRGGTRDGANENLTPPVQGKLLWDKGRRYLPDEFDDLPEVKGASRVTETVLEDEINAIDRREVWARVRLRVSKRVREFMTARETSGNRSWVLWEMERELADAGCTVTEIVAVVRETVWNKFVGRQDELKRLISEASKAISQRPEETTASLEEERESKPEPRGLMVLLQGVKPPQWLIQELWAEGSCGFIAGQPKAFKSWMALDLALSVGTGLPFLDHFSIRRPGPVLYIQEEDSLPMVKGRFDKVWPGKRADKMTMVDGEVQWRPAQEAEMDPPIAASIGEGFVISDGGWQAWLDEVLDKGWEGEPYRMVIIDPLMMVAGEVDENRGLEMTEKVFKPLKQLARKHLSAMAVVHHMRKGDPIRPQRGGQLMLGSVANHAWSEDSLYLRLARGGDIVIERESKNTTSGSFKVTHLRNKLWTPDVVDDKLDEEAAQEVGVAPAKSKRGPKKSKALSALEELGPGAHPTSVVAEKMGVGQSGAYRQLIRLKEKGTIYRDGTSWRLKGV